MLNSLFGGDRRDVSVEGSGPVGRVANSFCGMCFGFVMFFCCILLLGWNEFNFVRNQRIILHVEDTAVNVPCTPEASNNGKIVTAGCPITALPNQAESGLGLALKNILKGATTLRTAAITPSIEYYQWTEDRSCTKRRSDGREECTYRYNLGWSSSKTDSSSFHCQSYSSPGCIWPMVNGRDVCQSGRNPNCIQNPSFSIPALLQRSQYAKAGGITLGDASEGAQFALNDGEIADLVSQGGSEPIAIQDSDRSGHDQRFVGVQQLLGLSSSTWGSVGTDPAQPGKILFMRIGNVYSAGDLRVQFQKSSVRVQDVWTVLAKQSSNGMLYPFSAWDTGMSGSMRVVDWIAKGKFDLKGMVALKNSENSGLVWALRFVGFVLMFVSLMLITGPISAIPEMLPCIGTFLGEVVGCMLAVINFFVAAGVSLVVIGLAWLMARPAVGAVMLAAAAGLFALSVFCHKKHKGNRVALQQPLAMEAGLMQQPMVVQPQGFAQPGFAQPGVQPGFVQPGFAQPGFAQPGFAQPGAPAPTGMSAPAGSRVTVTCPAGTGPGMQVQVDTPQGPRIVVVPAGVSPGQPFDVFL